MNDNHFYRLILKSRQLRLFDPSTGKSSGLNKDSDVLRNNDIHSFQMKDITYRLEQADKRLLLIASLPAHVDGKTLRIESAVDVTDRFEFAEGLMDYENVKKALVTDELTGLYNRRFINQKLAEAIYRKRLPLSVMLVDIDRFKAVNDTFGHLAGDRVLCEFSRLLTGKIRADRDWAARYGGEEFLVCMENSDIEMAFKTADRIRQAAMFHRFECGEIKISLTCSIGIHTINESRFSVDSIIDLADKKLYRAKKAGRNIVVAI